MSDGHDQKLDTLMNDVVGCLVGGNPKHASEALIELAQYFARAGMPKESFFNMRKHLIDSAREQVGCPAFIKEQLECIERTMNTERTGSSIIITH